MTAVKISKAFTINMGPGTFESYRPEYSLELDVPDGMTIEEAFEAAEQAVDAAAYPDLTEAAQITEMRNTFILTWLKNREDQPYANEN